jgi:hypothetical protein
MNGNICNPREYRILKHLTVHGATFRKALNDIAGATNVPEHIRQMRQRGWILPCTRVHMVDRDGKPTKPGRYSLHPSEVEAACLAVQAWQEARQGAKPPVHDDASHF